jgi:hypothetical protein
MHRKLAAAAALTVGLASATAALAHHSFNMFALDKVTTIDATVKSVSWKMPHVWIYVTVPGPAGAEEWGLEGHSPNLIARKGWTSRTVKPGDNIQIAMHPMKDGSRAGSLIYAIVGGKKLWNADSLNNP